MRKAPSATTHGVLVQLVRMPACHAGGHEFESRTHRFHIATNGALVQLVRMPACHAGGHEFESRTHRFHIATNGALVQLVRMPACHAGGHEFESRTHRKKHPQKGCFFVLYIVYQLGKQLDQINYRKWNYQKSQKGGSKMEPPFATIGFDLLIMIDSYYFSIATTPGSTLPSMASNMAPPPVET